MKFSGVLRKMKTELTDEVQYYIDFPNHFLHVNQLLNHQLHFHFTGYQCLNCGKDKSIYRQGFCYDCFFESPKTGEWIINPELSTAHLGQEDRNLEYEKRVQLQPHIVYLANSGHVKVGITRKTQIPTRWIDQGAHEAIPILEMPNRYLAGVAEVALKAHISDKTNWRDMLKNKIDDVDILEIRDKLKQYLPEEVKDYFISNPATTKIHFPVLAYPQKIKSLSFKRKTEYKGILKGIKGQYLIFEDSTVLNIRNNSGYVIDLKVD